MTAQRQLNLALSLAFLVPVIVFGFVACSGGGSSAGASMDNPAISKAKETLRHDGYDEAAAMPVVMSDTYPTWYGWYQSGVIYLTPLWAENYKTNPRAPCTIVHEWVHSKQSPPYDENEARQVAKICGDKL